jgi:hypothetical protein
VSVSRSAIAAIGNGVASRSTRAASAALTLKKAAGGDGTAMPPQLPALATKRCVFAGILMSNSDWPLSGRKASR